MKKKTLIILAVLVIVTIAGVMNTDRLRQMLGPRLPEANTSAPSPEKHQFIFLGGSSFKTVGSEPVFADDCIGCGEIGDVSIYRNTERKPELTKHTVDAQCGESNKNLVERGDQLNENGEKIGVRCLTSYPHGPGHIFWSDGEELWFINARSLDSAREFEQSAVYDLWKRATLHTER